jgi:hypothetical protein
LKGGGITLVDAKRKRLIHKTLDEMVSRGSAKFSPGDLNFLANFKTQIDLNSLLTRLLEENQISIGGGGMMPKYEIETKQLIGNFPITRETRRRVWPKLVEMCVGDGTKFNSENYFDSYSLSKVLGKRIERVETMLQDIYQEHSIERSSCEQYPHLIVYSFEQLDKIVTEICKYEEESVPDIDVMKDKIREYFVVKKLKKGKPKKVSGKRKTPSPDDKPVLDNETAYQRIQDNSGEIETMALEGNSLGDMAGKYECTVAQLGEGYRLATDGPIPQPDEQNIVIGSEEERKKRKLPKWLDLNLNGNKYIITGSALGDYANIVGISKWSKKHGINLTEELEMALGNDPKEGKNGEGVIYSSPNLEFKVLMGNTISDIKKNEFLTLSVDGTDYIVTKRAKTSYLKGTGEKLTANKLEKLTTEFEEALKKGCVEKKGEKSYYESNIFRFTINPDKNEISYLTPLDTKKK